jgi:hypothetical protein
MACLGGQNEAHTVKLRKSREERAALREAALRRYEAARTARLAAEKDTYEAAVRQRETELEAAVSATVSKLAQRGEPLRLPALSVAVLATTVYVIRHDLSTRPLGPLAGAAATFKEIKPRVVHSHHMNGLGDPSLQIPSTRKVRRATATVTAGGQVHTFSVEGVGVPAAQHQVELFNALARQAHP